MSNRKSGVLLHLTSLPGKEGIGTLGKEAYAFADWLHKGNQTLWQVLPLGPTGYGDSPYASFSTFAGNPLLIDLDDLVERGWADAADIKVADYIKEEGEYASGGWLSTIFIDRTMGPTNQDKLWIVQSRIIRELAEKESCVRPFTST